LERSLNSIEGFWKDARINVTLYKNQPDFFIISDNNDMINRMDDCIINLSNILSNKYVEDIKP